MRISLQFPLQVNSFNCFSVHQSPECRAFEGRVIEVISGDTIVVAERNPEGGFTETRVILASIRWPLFLSCCILILIGSLVLVQADLVDAPQFLNLSLQNAKNLSEVD